MESYGSSTKGIAERGGTSRTDAVETTAETDLGTGIGAYRKNIERKTEGLGAGRMT